MFILVVLSVLSNLVCSYCENWFKDLKISSKDNCLLECASAPVGMGTFNCPKYCANLCDSYFDEMIIFNVQTSVYYPGLTYAERALISKYPQDAVKVLVARWESENLTKKTFKRNSVNDESDAFRHFVWSFKTTQKVGKEKGAQFLSAHENSDLQDTEEKHMDEYNNNKGMEYALKSENVSDEELKKYVLDLIKKGELKVIRKRGIPK
jgi:hypothetical protein